MWVSDGHGKTVNMLKILVHQILLGQFIQKWGQRLTGAVKVCVTEVISKSFLFRKLPFETSIKSTNSTYEMQV